MRGLVKGRVCLEALVTCAHPECEATSKMLVELRTGISNLGWYQKLQPTMPEGWSVVCSPRFDHQAWCPKHALKGKDGKS